MLAQPDRSVPSCKAWDLQFIPCGVNNSSCSLCQQRTCFPGLEAQAVMTNAKRFSQREKEGPHGPPLDTCEVSHHSSNYYHSARAGREGFLEQEEASELEALGMKQAPHMHFCRLGDSELSLSKVSDEVLRPQALGGRFRLAVWLCHLFFVWPSTIFSPRKWGTLPYWIWL